MQKTFGFLHTFILFIYIKAGDTHLNKKKKKEFPFLSILLVVFIAQLCCGLVINSAKIYSLTTKLSTLNNLNKVAEKKNRYLREELEKYSSNSGVEALVRNRLLFSKDDETLIIIKTPHNEEL